MGRSLKSAEAIPSVGEAWVPRAPRIYYLHPQNVGGLPGCSRHIALAAALGFDHICVGPIFESAPGDAATLSALWTVRRVKDGKTDTGRTTDREPTSQKSFEALAAAHSRALVHLSTDIADAIRVLDHAGQ